MDSQDETGRRLVIGIIVVTFVLSVLSVVMETAMRGAGTLSPRLVRLGLELILSFFLYAGANWARVVAGILYGLGGLVGLAVGWGLMQTHTAGIIVLILGIVYLASSIILLFVPSVQEHFS